MADLLRDQIARNLKPDRLTAEELEQYVELFTETAERVKEEEEELTERLEEEQEED